MRIHTTVVIVATICAVSVCDAQPRMEAVMTIDGIPGPIKIRVDLTDWAQIEGMPDPRTPQLSGTGGSLSSRPGSPLTSRGAAPGRDSGSAVLNDVALTKDVDKATPKLGMFSSQGRRMREVRLEIRPVGGSPGDRTVIKMKNAVITRITEQPSIRGGQPTEVVTFSCQSLDWETQPSSSPWGASPVPYTLTPKPP
jgi:type VI protein secretion system component Hcp